MKKAKGAILKCPNCKKHTEVMPVQGYAAERQQTTALGGSVCAKGKGPLLWRCRACEYEWPRKERQ